MALDLTQNQVLRGKALMHLNTYFDTYSYVALYWCLSLFIEDFYSPS